MSARSRPPSGRGQPGRCVKRSRCQFPFPGSGARGGRAGGPVTTPTVSIRVGSTYGLMVAVDPREPSFGVTEVTTPIGTPGTYGALPLEPQVTIRSPTLG